MSYSRMHRRQRVEDGVEINEYETEDNRRDMEKALAEKYGPSPSCLKCSHFKTCFLYRNELAMLESSFGMLQKKDWPNQPEDRAKYCHYYELEREEEKEQEGDGR